MSLKNLLPVFGILLFLLSCKTDQNVLSDHEIQGRVFGTTYSIKYLNTKQNYEASIDSLFNLVNQSVSTYIPNSIISKLNNNKKTTQVDRIFAEVFQKSKQIYMDTDGYFDPTVGNLVNAYGFGPERELNDLSQQSIDSLMQFVGLDKVTIKKDTIQKESEGIYLDFNSIAKGFGIDVIARFFDSKGIDSYLIEVGGEIRAKGTKRNEQPWLIRVVNPVDVENGYKVIDLTDQSMATSGNYRKFRISDDGTKYVHTINPKTGLAFESNLLSASVIAPKDCADVDAYATAFMAMGLEKTKAFLKGRNDLKVILIYTNAEGALEEFTTYP